MTINMVRMRDKVGISFIQTMLGLMFIGYGILCYYVIPISILFKNFFAFFLAEMILYFGLTVGVIFVLV